jgi:hypothetical protein
VLRARIQRRFVDAENISFHLKRYLFAKSSTLVIQNLQAFVPEVRVAVMCSAMKIRRSCALVNILCVCGGPSFPFHPPDVTFLIIFYIYCTRTYTSVSTYMSIYASTSICGASLHCASICGASICGASIPCASVVVRLYVCRTSTRYKNVIREHNTRMWYEHMVHEGTCTCG